MRKTAVLVLSLLLPYILTATPQEDFLTALRDSRLEDAAAYFRVGGDIDEQIEDGKTPLVLMCREQRSPIVRWLIEQGADPDLADSDQFTPLMYAAKIGNRDIVQILLLAGATLNRQDPFGNTPLQIAVNSGRWELAEYLESRGGQIRQGFFEHPVLSEIWTRRQHYEEALALPEKRWPAYSFLKAVRDGDYILVEEMLDQGASPDSADAEGVSALMISASLENPYISNLLLEKGADSNAADDMGLSCFWYASFCGRRDLVEKILVAGGDMEGVYLENSPLFAAFAGKQYDIMEYLLKQGADPGQTGRIGSSLLHYAAFTADLKILRLLDRSGVSLREADADGQTALDYLMKGYNLSEEESLYLEPARYLKEKKVAYTIDPNVTENVKLVKIITSIW